MLGDKKLVFLCGAPRSGTTWLQLMLHATGVVATAQETHLFSSYLKSLQQSWDFYASDKPARKGMGIGDLVSREEMIMFARAFADQVFSRMAEANSNASIILEKTPGHVMHAKFIQEVYPEAYFVHMVRDPRAAVSSLIAAAQGWAGKWAGKDAATNILIWRNHVRAGRILEQSDRCHLVRYETLLAAPSAGLKEVLGWLNCDVTDATIDNAVTEYQMGSSQEAKAGTPWDLSKEPTGFVRHATIDSWKNELSDDDIDLIENSLVEEMKWYGYR